MPVRGSPAIGVLRFSPLVGPLASAVSASLERVEAVDHFPAQTQDMKWRGPGYALSGAMHLHRYEAGFIGKDLRAIAALAATSAAGITAIHGQRYAGDEGSLVRGQPQDGIGHLVRASK